MRLDIENPMVEVNVADIRFESLEDTFRNVSLFFPK